MSWWRRRCLGFLAAGCNGLAQSNRLTQNQVADSLAVTLVMKEALKIYKYNLSDTAALEYAATPGGNSAMWARLLLSAGSANDPVSQSNDLLKLAILELPTTNSSTFNSQSIHPPPSTSSPS